MISTFKRTSVRIETEALVSLHEVATKPQKSSLGLHLYEREGCTVSVCQAEQGIMLNRSTGIGLFQPASENLMSWAVGKFRDHETHRAFMAISEGAEPRDLYEQARMAGLEEARAWTKFCRDLAPTRVRPCELTVRPLEIQFAREWGRIVAASFDMPESTAVLLARLIRHPGWHLYMSFFDDQPAGAAGMFISEGIAWFDWAATEPKFRRMGSQGALMSARIEEAARLGCTSIMTATGEAVEGNPQHSWGNIGRYGFKPGFRTRNFAFSTPA